MALDLSEGLRSLADDAPAGVDVETVAVRVRQRARRRWYVRAAAGVAAIALIAGGVAVAGRNGTDTDPAVVVGEPTATVIPPVTDPVADPSAIGPLPPADVSPVNAGWERLDPGPLAPRANESVVWTGSELIVWGGRVPEGQPVFGDGAAYDPSTRAWRMLAPAPIAARADHIGVWTGTEMIVWGGAPGLLDGAAYDPSSDSWRTIAAAPVESGAAYVGVWAGEELVVYGWMPIGVVVAAYQPSTNTWRDLPEPDLRPEAPVILWTGDHIVLVPRIPGIVDFAAAIYDPPTGTWRSSTAEVFRAQAVGAAALGGKVYVGSYMPLNDIDPQAWAEGGMAVLDPADGGWQVRTPFPVDGCEGLPLLVAIGDRLFEEHCGTMGTYDPSTDRWTVVPGPTASIDQVSRTAVWAGDQLLSWDPGIPIDTTNFRGGEPAAFWSFRP